MPSLELNPNSNRYHLRFRFAGRAFKRSLSASDRTEAEAALARVTETMSLVERGVLELPAGADVTAFFLTHGKRSKRPELQQPFTLDDRFAKYQNSLPSHAKEDSTLETEAIHLRHFRRHLPIRRALGEITTETVQAYVIAAPAAGEEQTHQPGDREAADGHASWNFQLGHQTTVVCRTASDVWAGIPETGRATALQNES